MNKAFEFASWLFLSAIMNLIVPRLLPYFTLERIWKHCRDILYLFMVWLLYRFVWFPVNRMLAFMKKSCQSTPSMASTCIYMPMVSMSLAILCLVASLYFTGHLSKDDSSTTPPKDDPVTTFIAPPDDTNRDDGRDWEQYAREKFPPMPTKRAESTRAPRSRRTVRPTSEYD